ncbi:MAG: hypothetical protein JNL57_11970 [Bacteroidetes bacterium]|nr:hypothetical protein [Bacteroidota bacterium]
MKIRISGPSLRFRLSRSDLHTLAETGTIQSSIQLGTGNDQQWIFQLVTGNVFDMDYHSGLLTLTLPAEEVTIWSTDNREGLYFSAETAPGVRIKIAVEKDYACLDGNTAQKDVFENPLKHTQDPG